MAWAGHTLVQRPHIVQASVSSSCFHVKSSTTDAPNVSSSVSARLGSGFIAPFGRSWCAQVHVQRRGEHVPQHRQREDDEEGDERDDVGDPRPLVDGVEGVHRPAVDEPAERPADEAPLLVVRRHSIRPPPGRRSILGDAEHLGGEPGEADGQQHAEDHGVLRAGLDADAVGAGDVAAGDRPQQPADEHQPGEVGDEGVRLVGAAVEELEALGELVVDLQHGGHGRAGRGTRSRSSSASARRPGRAAACACTPRRGSRRSGAWRCRPWSAGSAPAGRAPSSSSARRTGTHPTR